MVDYHNSFVITLDIDWAPDFMIDEVAAYLIDKGVKTTWFVTHDSPAVRKLIDRSDLIECGLHPNFVKDSSQGKDEKEVIEYLQRILPDSTIMRTHELIQSTPLLAMLCEEYGIDTDVSLFLPSCAGLTPHLMYFKQDGSPMLRIPYFWEDDIEMHNPQKSWRLSENRYHVKGLKVFNFHPIHIYLNSDSMQPYEQLKGIGSLVTRDRKTAAQFINRDSAGTRTLFEDLVNYIAERQDYSLSIGEIAHYWRDHLISNNT